VTGATVVSHISSAALHRQINDAVVSLTNLWSATKITTELSGKAPTVHTHDVFDATTAGFAPATGAALVTDVLRADGTWGSVQGADIKLVDLSDVGTALVGDGNTLMASGAEWVNAQFISSPTVDVTISTIDKTLQFATTDIVTLGPATTTAGYIPVWNNAANELADGYLVVADINDDGIPTAGAVRARVEPVETSLGALVTNVGDLETAVSEITGDISDLQDGKMDKPPVPLVPGDIAVVGVDGVSIEDGGQTISALTAAILAAAKVETVRRVISVSTVVSATDMNLLFATGGSDRTCTLPSAAASTGRAITVKKIDTLAGKVTVGNGTDGIDDITGTIKTFDIVNTNDTATFVSDGFIWFVK